MPVRSEIGPRGSHGSLPFGCRSGQALSFQRWGLICAPLKGFLFCASGGGADGSVS